MESISRETLWDGLGLFSTVDAEGTNASSFLSQLTSLNTSRVGGDGSFLGVFPGNASTATPHTLAQPRVRDAGLARAEITVLSLILALTTLGNGFVLWVLLRRRKQNAPMHLFMVNLCVADLVVAFFQVSEVSGGGNGGDIVRIVLLCQQGLLVYGLLSRAGDVGLQTDQSARLFSAFLFCLWMSARNALQIP